MESNIVSMDLDKQIESVIKDRRRYFWDKGPLTPQQDKYVIIERVLEFGMRRNIHFPIKQDSEGASMC